MDGFMMWLSFIQYARHCQADATQMVMLDETHGVVIQSVWNASDWQKFQYAESSVQIN